MRRFVKIKDLVPKPQAVNIVYKGDSFAPVFLHSTIDQDRPIGSKNTFVGHVHDFYHIVLYTQGGGKYLKENLFLPAEKDCCVLIYPGQRHDFVSHRGSTVYSELTFSYESAQGQRLTIPFEELLELYSGMKIQIEEGKVLSAEHRQVLQNLFIQTIDYLNSSLDFSFYHAHRTLGNIFDFLVEHCSRHPQSSLIDDRFRQVHMWIEEHYHESLSMDEMVKMAGVSKGYFFRAFKKAFGVPPLTYQLNLRIQAAKTLLRATSLHCNEIAYRTGFTDVYFFHRTFKKHVGMTAIQYRKSPR